MESDKPNSRVMLFRESYTDDKSGKFIELLGLTDIHFDSKHCDRKLLTKHLNEAKERGAKIFINGDLLDAMGCERDPRSKASDIRPEYLASDASYLDLVIDDAVQFLMPYKELILFIGYGNHETAILKFRDTDPLKRIVSALNAAGGNILLSQYDGVAKFTFEQKKQAIRTFIMYHNHGYGGNAKRSKGVLNVDLNGQMFPFADLIFTGHIHQSWHVPIDKMILKANNELVSKTQHHVCGGHYKDESKEGFGWAKQKGFTSTPTGGWWINVLRKGNKRKVEIQITRAS